MFKAYAIISKDDQLVANDHGSLYMVPFSNEGYREIADFYKSMVDDHEEWQDYRLAIIGELYE